MIAYKTCRASFDKSAMARPSDNKVPEGFLVYKRSTYRELYRIIISRKAVKIERRKHYVKHTNTTY